MNSLTPTSPTSSSGSSSNSEETVATSRSPTPEQPRKKKWAPKSKTGCLTCRYVCIFPFSMLLCHVFWGGVGYLGGRLDGTKTGETTLTRRRSVVAHNRARRVKCDEGKPACKKCVTGGRTCQGYEDPFVTSSPPWQVKIEATSMSRRASSESVKERQVSMSRQTSVKSVRPFIVPDLEPFECDFAQCAKYCKFSVRLLVITAIVLTRPSFGSQILRCCNLFHYQT